MSLNSKRIQNLNKNKFEAENDYFSVLSLDEKKLNKNTISTIEKERSTKDRPTKDRTVKFKGIEIIEVESYKKYNQIPIISFESIESDCIKTYEECRCNIF